MQIKLNDNPSNRTFRDFNLEKRDHIIEYGLFLDQNGLQNIKELYQEDQLEEYNTGKNKRLTEENQRLGDSLLTLQREVESLKSEKLLIKEETQRETEVHMQSSYEDRLRHRQEVITDLENNLSQVKTIRQEDISRLREEQVFPLQQENRELREERKSAQEEMKREAAKLLLDKETTLLEKHALQETIHRNKISDLEARLEESNRWNLNSNTTSGNVAKGNMGEKCLKEILSKNLQQTLGTTCEVEDVSKGSGGNADLLISIPERKLNILIESKNKLSEKVRSVEIDRAKSDLNNNVHEANILLLVSFQTGCVRHEHLHTSYRTTEDQLKIFSVYTHFADHYQKDAGSSLCDWINFLTKSYVEVSPLVGNCDKSCLSNVLTDLESIIQNTCEQEKRLKSVMDSLGHQLADITRLRMEQLPNLKTQIKIAVSNNR